jgi:hypothetical protein
MTLDLQTLRGRTFRGRSDPTVTSSRRRASTSRKRILPGLTLLVSLLSGANPAMAQPTDRAASVVQAQAQWRKGTRAAVHGDYETARAAFEQAYELLEEPALLFALGDAEVRTGRFLDGARHLATFMATQAGTDAQRDAAAKALEKASPHVSRLTFRINTSDAAVQIDGDAVGHTPLPEPFVYVSPGTHQVTVEKPNYAPLKRTVELGTGQIETLEGELAPEPTNEEALGIVPRPSVAPPRPAAATSAPTLAAASRSLPMSEPPPPIVDRSISGRTVVIISGSVLTAAALGVGVTFFLKKESAANDREAAIQSLGGANCVSPSGTQAAPCLRLASAVNAIADDNTVMNWAFPAAGVLAAATTAAAIFWPRSAPNRSTATLMPLPGGGLVRFQSAF